VRGRHTLEGLLVDPIDGARQGSLTIEGDLIGEVREEGGNEGRMLFPGFVDLHVYDPIDLPGRGVTGYLQTGRRPFESADPLCLGIHLEGPFLNPAAAGAIPVDELLSVDLVLLEQWLARGDVRLVTVSPELPGGLEAIALVSSRAVAAIGHTHANAATARAAVEVGATFVTHLWNAMPPLRARSTGPVPELLLEEKVTLGLIADGRHLHPRVEELTVRVAGPDRIALTSDLVGEAVLPDNRLAGGSRAGAQLVRRMARYGLAEAATMASLVPARLLGLSDRGRIAPGFRADIAVLSRDFAVLETIVAGKSVWALRYPETQQLDEIPPSTHAPGTGA
jgi:N-acetylglucosamine-6-phosphate deacetylase